MFLAFDQIAAGEASLDSPCLSARKRRPRADRAWASRAVKQFPEKLLLGMAVSSGNDASHAVAEFIGSSSRIFCEDDERRKGRQAGYALTAYSLNPTVCRLLASIPRPVTCLRFQKPICGPIRIRLQCTIPKCWSMTASGHGTKSPLGQYPGPTVSKSRLDSRKRLQSHLYSRPRWTQAAGVILGAPDM